MGNYHQAHCPVKPLKTVLVAFVYFVLGVACTKAYFSLQKPVITTVYLPATDEQLLGYWFGSTDKTKLRNRICKRF